MNTSRLQRRTLRISFALWAITVLGFGARLYEIGKNPLWLDEAYSVWLSGQSILNIFRYTIDIDQHPPLYAILLHLWMQIGGASEEWVRAFSALAGTLTIPAIFLFGKRIGGTRLGLVAALVLAVSPFHVQYGQEARVYALLSLTACISMWMTARLLTDPRASRLPVGQQVEDFLLNRELRASAIKSQGKPGGEPPARLPIAHMETDLTWLGYMFFVALTVYGHNTAIFLPITLNILVFGLMLHRRFYPNRKGQFQAPSIRNWVIAQVGVFLFWSPWLAAFIYQASGVYEAFWISSPNLETVQETLQSFLMAFLPDRIAWKGLIWLAFAIVFLLAASQFRNQRDHLWFLAGLFLIPFLGELLVSVWVPIFADRTLIWTTIPLYVLIAAGICRLRYPSYIFTAALVLVTLSWLSLNHFFTYYEKERWDLAAAHVDEQFENGDIIIFNAGWTQLPFEYYFSQYEQPVEVFGAPVTLFERGELEPRMTEDDLPYLQNIIRGRSRVWLVYSHNWWTDPDALIPNTLNQEMRLIDTQYYTGIQVHLYEQQ